MVDVVERGTTELAAPEDEQAVREAVLRYSREIAFAAAEVYAQAAEARGAWDARLEDLVVDAILRGETDDALTSRATALGWAEVSGVAVVAGRSSTPISGSATIDDLRRALTRFGCQSLVAVQRHRLVVILGGVDNPTRTTAAVAGFFGDGPIVVGSTVGHLFEAAVSARDALAGLAAVAAWPQAPRPVLADELLPERALNDDRQARDVLVERIVRPLQTASRQPLLETADVFLASGHSLEQTARLLFVHPNTVRYRLGRIGDLTGYDLQHPRDAMAAGLALAYARLADDEPVATPR